MTWARMCGAYGFAPEIARQIVTETLGRPLEEVYDVFEDHPFAATSISQESRVAAHAIVLPAVVRGQPLSFAGDEWYTPGMRIYLDTCSLQRPLDNKAQLRVLLESEAVLGLLALCEAGNIELMSSEALVFENERNPNLTRQEYASQVLAKASMFVVLEAHVEERARELNRLGFKPLDALHLASAEAGLADYLCTCDDRFLNRARASTGLRTKVVAPVQLIGELE